MWRIASALIVTLLLASGCEALGSQRARLSAEAREQARIELFSKHSPTELLSLLQVESAKKAAGAAPTCGGLVSQMCQACPDGGPDDLCKSIHDECSNVRLA